MTLENVGKHVELDGLISLTKLTASSRIAQVGSQTPVYAVNSEFGALKERNELQRRRVDDVLTKRLQLEKRAKQVGRSGVH